MDFAAPKGTRVLAAADGHVIGAGWRNGYGNAVEIKHGGGITTLYGHLSGFASGIRAGARVRQGEPDRIRRRDRLGDRAAPALRVQDLRHPPGSDARRPPEGHARARAPARPQFLSRRRATRARHSRSCAPPRRPASNSVAQLFAGVMSGTSLDGADAAHRRIPPGSASARWRSRRSHFHRRCASACSP